MEEVKIDNPVDTDPLNKKGNKEFHRATELTNEQTAEIIYKLATGDVPETRIVHDYKIGRRAIERFKSNHRFKIAELRAELEKQRDEIFKSQLASRRSQILESITDKDIKKAGLGTKTRSVVDLTTVKNLEEGKATANIDVHIGSMSKDDLIKFVVGQEADNGAAQEVLAEEGVTLPNDK